MNTPMGAQSGHARPEGRRHALTGTMTAAAAPDPMEITDGAVDGDYLTWKAALTQPMPITLEFYREGRRRQDLRQREARHRSATRPFEGTRLTRSIRRPQHVIADSAHTAR